MEIRVVIGDYEYSNASLLSFSINKSAKNISHNFNATLSLPPFSSYEDYKSKMKIQPQQDIQFYFNDVLFMAGIAETVIIEMGNKPAIQLSGRSKMLFLVQSQGVIKQYKQKNLEKLIKEVFDDNSITSISVSNKIGSTLQTIPNMKILMKSEDTIFNFIDRYAIICRCVAISDNQGNLLLTREGGKEDAIKDFDIQIYLPTEGVSNAEGVNYTNDFTNRTRFIEIISSTSANRLTDSASSVGEKTKVSRIIEDVKVKYPTRRRQNYKISGNGEVLDANNEWFLRRVRAESDSLKVKLLGNNAETFLGKNPELLQLIKVTNQHAMIENVFMVIAEIATSFSNDNGLEVALLLVPTDSYTFAVDSKTFMKSLKNTTKAISQIDPPQLILKLEPKIKELYLDPIDKLYKTQKIENVSAGNVEAIERLAFKRNIANKKYLPSK